MRVLLCQITLQMHAVTLWLSLLMLSKCMLLLVLSGLHFSVSNERKKWCGVLSFGFEGFRFTFCDCGALPILFPTICSLCGLSGNRSITCLTVSIYKKLFRNSGLQLDNSASSLGDSGNYAYLPAWQESYPLKSIICSSLHSCATWSPKSFRSASSLPTLKKLYKVQIMSIKKIIGQPAIRRLRFLPGGFSQLWTCKLLSVQTLLRFADQFPSLEQQQHPHPVFTLSKTRTKEIGINYSASWLIMVELCSRFGRHANPTLQACGIAITEARNWNFQPKFLR